MVVFLDRSLHSLLDRNSVAVRPFALLTVRPFTSFTEGPFASLTEGSMSLSARRAVSQRSGLSTQWSLNVVVPQPVGRFILIVGSCGCGVRRDEDSYPPRPCISQRQYRLGWSFYIRPPLPAT